MTSFVTAQYGNDAMGTSQIVDPNAQYTEYLKSVFLYKQAVSAGINSGTALTELLSIAIPKDLIVRHTLFKLTAIINYNSPTNAPLKILIQNKTSAAPNTLADLNPAVAGPIILNHIFGISNAGNRLLSYANLNTANSTISTRVLSLLNINSVPDPTITISAQLTNAAGDSVTIEAVTLERM